MADFYRATGILLLSGFLLLLSCETGTVTTTAQKEAVVVPAESALPEPPQAPEIPVPTRETVEAFYEAVFENNTQKVSQMLATTFPASYEPPNKITPLQAVIWTSDNVTLARLLVEGGASIYHPDAPAVVVAAEYKRMEILKYLVGQGKDFKNTEAFNKAGFHQFYGGARLLLLRGARQEGGDARGKLWVFHQAVRKLDYEVLDALKLSPEDLNYNDDQGETALIMAVRRNNREMVDYLLRKGADKHKPETFDSGDEVSYGKTPLQIAVDSNFRQIGSLLKK